MTTNATRRGRRRSRPLAAFMAAVIALLTITALPTPAAAAEVCANTSTRTSTYSFLGMDWYRHEARGRACRDNGRVVRAEVRTNRIVKIGIAFADWTNTREQNGTDWTNHYVAAGVSDGSVSIKGVTLPVNISKKHEFDFDYYLQNGSLYNRYSQTSWYW